MLYFIISLGKLTLLYVIHSGNRPLEIYQELAYWNGFYPSQLVEQQSVGTLHKDSYVRQTYASLCSRRIDSTNLSSINTRKPCNITHRV
jgi:hypothetical protein